MNAVAKRDAPPADFWQGRSVLITGCNGFLGTRMTQLLVERGAEVVGLVRDQVPWSPLHREGIDTRMVTVRGEVQDQALIERVLNEYEVTCVFHLAAQAIVGVANRNPVATFESNIQGTWCVLEACRRSRLIERVVVASSDKAYGDHLVLPYTEEHALAARHPYDVSKSCADLIALTYAHTYGLPVGVTRCGNIFGPRDLNFSRVIPGTIRSALRGERPVIRSDGSPVRDYIYIDDVVSGYLHLAERLERETVKGRAFNFGTGEQQSVLGLTELILKATGRPDLTPVILNEAKAEIANQYLSFEAAQRDLDWSPASSIAARLDETVAWYRRYLDLA
ncbi:MAG: GDP-mannose 4,6-dehydratase [Gammaproteobacteria bacterium]|nr:GDP-mannose 4,6-dehydratase [Gammaproteobacteria bacterium]